jgi:hypothetical protein
VHFPGSHGEETHARLLIYVAVNLIDLKTKYFKDRRGLEQKEWDFWIFIFPFFLYACSSERLWR